MQGLLLTSAHVPAVLTVVLDAAATSELASTAVHRVLAQSSTVRGRGARMRCTPTPIPTPAPEPWLIGSRVHSTP